MANWPRHEADGIIVNAAISESRLRRAIAGITKEEGMSRRRWALQPVWFGAFVFGLIGYLAAPLVAQSTSAGSSQAFSASGTSPFLRQPAAGGLPEPAVAAMAIVWF